MNAESFDNLALHHYENFPVGSLFIPKHARRVIHLIYAFARTADDIADEGVGSMEEKQRQIDEWGAALRRALEGDRSNTLLSSLAEEVDRLGLPVSLFEDLLKAFRKDCENPLYDRFSDVLEYCTYSANPIGRLLLKIFNCSNAETERYSDDICTALQLTNFWQDISVDTRRNRFYIAREECERFGFAIADLRTGERSGQFQRYLRHQVEWTNGLFESGKPLLSMVPGRFRFELKLIWHGGKRVLEKIESLGFDTRRTRPVLDRTDTFIIAARALRT